MREEGEKTGDPAEAVDLKYSENIKPGRARPRDDALTALPMTAPHAAAQINNGLNKTGSPASNVNIPTTTDRYAAP